MITNRRLRKVIKTKKTLATNMREKGNGKEEKQIGNKDKKIEKPIRP